MSLSSVGVAILIGASSLVGVIGSAGVTEQHRVVGGSTDNCPGRINQPSVLAGGAYWCPPPRNTGPHSA